MRLILVLVFVFSFSVPASAQYGLTASELAKMTDDWPARLQTCEIVTRAGTIVQLRCKPAALRYVTVNVGTGEIIQIESRRSRVGMWVQIVLSVVLALAGGAACANDRC